MGNANSHDRIKFKPEYIDKIVSNYKELENLDRISKSTTLNKILCEHIPKERDKIKMMKVGDVLRGECPGDQQYYKRYSKKDCAKYLKKCNKEDTDTCYRCGSVMYLWDKDGDDYSFPDAAYSYSHFCSNTACGIYHYYKYTPTCNIF